MMAPHAPSIIPVHSADQMALAYALRRRVFVEEQGIDERLERDEDDLHALHVLAMDGDQVVGCGRSVRSGEWIKIGRMAVLAERRGQGIGRAVLDYLLEAGRQQGAKAAYLHAQVTAEGFYLKRGFRPVGGLFEEAGIQHRRMELALCS